MNVRVAATNGASSIRPLAARTIILLPDVKCARRRATLYSTHYLFPDGTRRVLSPLRIMRLARRNPCRNLLSLHSCASRGAKRLLIVSAEKREIFKSLLYKCLAQMSLADTFAKSIKNKFCIWYLTQISSAECQQKYNGIKHMPEF